MIKQYAKCKGRAIDLCFVDFQATPAYIMWPVFMNAINKFSRRRCNTRSARQTYIFATNQGKVLFSFFCKLLISTRAFSQALSYCNFIASPIASSKFHSWETAAWDEEFWSELHWLEKAISIKQTSIIITKIRVIRSASTACLSSISNWEFSRLFNQCSLVDSNMV